MSSCWFATSGASWVKLETSSHTLEGKERWKKEANPSRLVGGRFNKQRNLCEMSRSLHLPPQPPRILKNVYVEVLTGFSHIFSPGGLNHTLLSQVCILVIPSGKSRWDVHSMDRRGSKEPLTSQVQLTGQPAVISSQ